MTKLFGQSANHLLFTDGTSAVVIDRSTNMVENIGELAVLASAQVWSKADVNVDQVYYDLATGALADLRVQVVVASGRMYTIPKGVQEEAKKALEWRKEHRRGGTPVGLNTARILANGGQIGLRKVRHVAKYFPRHEVDKKAKGWDPGEDNFPSNGRIAWALWGGDAAWRWSQAIVERERKKGTIAGGFIVSSDDESYEYETATRYDADVDAFSNDEIDGEPVREFVARVRMDESGIDRLYMIDELGDVRVWDGGSWDDLGLVDADVYSLDLAIDDDDDLVEKSHIFIDSDSALILSAHLQQRPFDPVTVFDLNEDEAMLVAAAADDMDWETIDAVVSAAEAPKQGQGDGEYTPEERSQKARKQVRDATGKFAAMGSRVSVNSQNRQGNIVGINPDTQSVRVRFDDGSETEVPAKDTTKAEDMAPQTMEVPSEDSRLDTSGILGQPRAPIDRPNATLPEGLPALTPDQLQQVIGDFPAWVKSQRERQQAPSPRRPVPTDADARASRQAFVRDLERRSGVQFEEDFVDLREHPLYSKLFKKKPIYNLYYNPMISAATVTDDEPMTPETSDVQPMYMAIVSPEDPRAVFDLVAIVPASAKSTTPATYKRVDKKWVRDDQILADLTSPTPPPVVPLSGADLQDTLAQIDGVTASGAVVAVGEGGLDRNRGGAEKLRRYWLYGKGALKIRWNTPGDWTRCYRQLRKYMGIRAKGYCSLRHKEATGVWPGSKFNIGRKRKGVRGGGFFEELYVPSEEDVVRYVYTRARIADARARVLTAAAGIELEMIEKKDGARFTIPLVIPEDAESGDGRIFKKGSIEIRELPLPLLWQIHTADGHNGSVVVGRIDGMERTEEGIGNAYGVFDSSSYGQEVERMVREGFVRGVSADLDRFEASESEADDEDAAAKGKKKTKKIGGDKIVIDHARVMAVTIVPKPAFQECRIYLDENTTVGESQEDKMNSIPDGVYAEDVDETEANAIVACGAVAGSIPTVPPATWFSNPKLSGATPLTVDDAGRVFGHIAAWNTNHIGMSYGTRPPRSKSKYSYFHTGVVRADDGKDYPVGQLTLAGGHASLEASAVDAAKHYDDTGSAIADVHAGEDAYGIWVAGALRPSATPEQVRALRASAPSGDWRPINGALELVAVCQVNVPGFPIARARVASGQVYALVAAGARVLAKMKSDPVTELAARIEALENAANASVDADDKAELSTRAAEARAKFEALKTEKHIEIVDLDIDLSARVASARAEAELGAISMRVRDRLAKEGKALPDGSYPIRNVEDLKNAIQAYGRSKKSKRAQVRRHIMKRARALGKSELIPEQWKAAAAIDEDVADISARVASAKARLAQDDQPET